jgi:hypothetical protein
VESEEETRAGGEGYGFVPHFLPGQNPYLDEFATEFGIPVEAATSGSAETMSPDYRKKMATMKKPAAAPTK